MLQPYLIAGRVEAGCDEAGRGCLAGPVTAAAVILPPDFHNDLINDSKQLTERQREQLRPVIERDAQPVKVSVEIPVARKEKERSRAKMVEKIQSAPVLR